MASLNLKFDSVQGIDINQSMTIEHFKQWRKVRADLILRAADLLELSKDKRTDPKKAVELKRRSFTLYDEALRMEKNAKKGLSTNQLRRDAVIGWLVLVKDGVKTI